MNPDAILGIIIGILIGFNLAPLAWWLVTRRINDG